MEQRLANTWHLSINEKKFLESALLNDIRIDGRQPFDYRQINIKFGKEDGSSEVQLGDTHVIGYVSGQLVQPYRDRPNEGTLSIFVEFSPMADPAFEPGRPGEFAVELGRLIDRGLRESRAVDMESLCVAAGKSVWAIRVDLHILDNGGNLIDAANIAALTALLSYRRPECTLGGENGQDVFIHDIEVRDPLPLIVHHVPVAVTFAFLNEGDLMVIDPTYKEEAIMGGRMTATLNSNGDICAVQKSGGAGVSSNMIMQCLRLAALKAVDITSKIKNAVDAHDTERALRKVKRRTFWTAPEINVSNIMVKDDHSDQFAKHPAQNINDQAGRTFDATTVHKKHSNFIKKETHAFIGASSNWDPYTQGISTNLAKNAQFFPDESQETDIIQMQIESHSEETTKASVAPSSSSSGASGMSQQRKPPKSLEDSVKSKRSNKNRDNGEIGIELVVKGESSIDQALQFIDNFR